MRLINRTKDLVLSEQVETASGLLARMKGLLGRTHLPQTHSLHIPHCNSIHTCFMKFSIDAVFVDSELRVQHISRDIKPWNIVLPVLKADSVFEFSSGVVKESSLSLGDQLYVGH